MQKKILAVLLASMFVSHAWAEDKTINISAQDMPSALHSLASQTGIQLLFSADELKNLTAKELSGAMSVEEALKRLLQGTNYTYRATGKGTFVLQRIGASLMLREVEVTDSPYVVPNATTATKTDTPLMQTPMTVEVLPQQMLKEQGITSSGLTDALAYLGVQTLGMRDSGDYLIFRGFTSATTLWNGFRIEDATPGINYANGGVWMDNVDRLEVLKGPASILYGRTEPGGAVNVLTKKPQADFRGEVNVGGGSWANRWLGVDVTGSLNGDKTVLGRINLAQEDSDSWFRYGDKYHSQGVAPALEWRISPQTTLSLEGQYRSVEGGTTGQQYMPIDPATGQPIAVDPSLTMLPGNSSKTKQNRTSIALDHAFDSDWSVSWKYLHNDADSTGRSNLVMWFNAVPPGPADTLLMVFGNKSRQKTDATILDVTGHVEALGIKHTLLLGADYYKKQFDQVGGSDWAQTTDYFNPTPPTPVAYTDTWNISTRESALYAQDQMELPRNWHLLLGGRQQSIDEHNIANTPSMNWTTPTDVVYKKSVFLPRLGLLWQAQPWLSTYYSYAENTGSSNGLDFTGTPIKPESSKQHEVGVKTTWLDERLSANLALFELTKFNIASADPANPGFNIGVGEVKSTGYELNIQGALTHAWNVLANYSHARPYVVTGATGAAALQPQNIVAGQLLPYVSNDSFSVWTSYKLRGEGLSGWTVGGGANWASAPNMDATSSIKTKAYSVVSAFASYETKLGGHKTALQLNVNNLFNEKYMTYQGDSAPILYGVWGTPRQVKLNAKVEF